MNNRLRLVALALGMASLSVANTGVAPLHAQGPPAGGRAPSAAPATGAAPAAAKSSAATLPAPAPILASPIVRGLYVNRFAAQSQRRMRQLIALADSTEINAFVIDVKDEFGLNYASADPVVQRNAGNAGSIPNLRALLDTLKAHKILAIARIVVFKDSVTARVHPQWTIRTASGDAWRDKQGLTWVNPYSRELWDYNVRIAEEAVRLGFGEIQFDYIRFPEPYKSLPTQVFPGSNGVDKPVALAEFLSYAKARIGKLGVRTTADVFGLVTTLAAPLEIGQQWEVLSPRVDVMLPMVYPSHYPRGAFGVARPNAEPYKIIFAAINRARERDEKLGIRSPEHVRAWLQAFSLGQPPYGAEEVRAQKRAVYDAGYDGWVLWHPGSKYEAFVPALERELVSRKKALSTAPAAKD
ncbi:MAG: putative glycoside hydrolase [Gemmatimonadetes bacterium]|nr:putative glycoside hydrolase [Gemmatimonadota bacterium]